MSKLLIVDDSDDLLALMKYFLRRKGYIVNTLNKVDDIYEMIREFQPDLLILDLFLFDNDGREICKELKGSLKSKDLYILVFSASPKLLADYKSYYADDFMEKPFELTDLVEKIETVLTCHQSLPEIPDNFIVLE